MPLLVIISFSTTDYKLVGIDKFDSCHLKYSGLFRLRIKHITISTNMIMTNSDVKKIGYIYQNGLCYVCYSDSTVCFNGFTNVRSVKGVFSNIPRYNIIDNVSLKEVCLPDYIQIDNQKYRVTAIAASSFSGCRELETITIPKTIEKIEWNMLYLERLCQIKVDEANLFFKDINGVLYTKDGKTIIAYPNKHSSEYEICSGTVTISHFTFKGCSNLQKVIIPLSVRFIGNNAFYRCVNLKKVYIHDLIEPSNIGKYIDNEEYNEPQIVYRKHTFDSINEIQQWFVYKTQNMDLIKQLGAHKKGVIAGTNYELYSITHHDIIETERGNLCNIHSLEAIVDEYMNFIMPFEEQEFTSSIFDNLINVKRGMYQGLLSKIDFHWIVPCEYDDIYKGRNYIRLRKGDRYGVVDYNGNTFIPFVIDANKYGVDVSKFDGKLLPFYLLDELRDDFTCKWGFMNIKGEIVISSRFDEICSGFNNGKAKCLMGV